VANGESAGASRFDAATNSLRGKTRQKSAIAATSLIVRDHPHRNFDSATKSGSWNNLVRIRFYRPTSDP
jgi:hypothetical protein